MSAFLAFIAKLTLGFILLPLILVVLFVILILVSISLGRSRIRIVRIRVSDETHKKINEGKIIDAEWKEVKEEKNQKQVEDK